MIEETASKSAREIEGEIAKITKITKGINGEAVWRLWSGTQS